MESHHSGSEKHFLKVLLYHERLEDSIKKLLDGHTPFYPLHLTLTTIHLSKEANNIFDLISYSIDNWKPPLPEALLFDDWCLEVMGRTHIKFLSLCFSADNLRIPLLINNLCEYLAEDLGLEKREIEVNGMIECELLDSTHMPIIHIPLGEKKTHVSLLSSNDLKNNKRLFKLYRKDASILLNLIDIGDFTTSPFKIGSKSLT